MRIAFAGGGTGGHVFPIQSLIKYIDKKYPATHSLFWFGEKNGLEFHIYQKLQAKITDLSFLAITSGKRRRQREFFAIAKNFIGLLLLLRGVVVSIGYILRYKIDVVFCKGGYVSLPVVIAGRLLRKKVLLHESDTTPGLANRICSKFATTLFTGFSGVFPGKEIVVGQILDDELVESSDVSLIPGYMEFSSNSIFPITHILVTGGSQGSLTVYKALSDILRKHDRPHTQFYITLGTQNHTLAELFRDMPHVTVFEFADQATMGALLQLCDVAVTRGGTTSLAEQELFGIKKIIIPIPRTHDQFKNAQYYLLHYQDILIDQNLPTYTADFEKAILEYATYKKESFVDPLLSIRQTKDAILKVLLSH